MAAGGASKRLLVWVGGLFFRKQEAVVLFCIMCFVRMRINLVCDRTRHHTRTSTPPATLTRSAPQLWRRFWLRLYVCSSGKMKLYESLVCVRRGIHNKVLAGCWRSLPSSQKQSGSPQFPFCSWAKSAVWICSTLFVLLLFVCFWTRSRSPSCMWSQSDHCLRSVIIEIHKVKEKEIFFDFCHFSGSFDIVCL